MNTQPRTWRFHPRWNTRDTICPTVSHYEMEELTEGIKTDNKLTKSLHSTKGKTMANSPPTNDQHTQVSHKHRSRMAQSIASKWGGQNISDLFTELAFQFQVSANFSPDQLQRLLADRALEYKEAYHKREADIIRLEDSLVKARKRINDLGRVQDQNDKLEATNNQLRNRIINLEKENNRQEKTIDNMESNFQESMAQHCSALTRRDRETISALTKELEERNQSIVGYRREIAGLNHQLQKTTESLDIRRKQVSELTETNTTLQAALIETRRRCQSLEAFVVGVDVQKDRAVYGPPGIGKTQFQGPQSKSISQMTTEEFKRFLEEEPRPNESDTMGKPSGNGHKNTPELVAALKLNEKLTEENKSLKERCRKLQNSLDMSDRISGEHFFDASCLRAKLNTANKEVAKLKQQAYTLEALLANAHTFTNQRTVETSVMKCFQDSINTVDRCRELGIPLPTVHHHPQPKPYPVYSLYQIGLAFASAFHKCGTLAFPDKVAGFCKVPHKPSIRTTYASTPEQFTGRYFEDFLEELKAVGTFTEVTVIDDKDIASVENVTDQATLEHLHHSSNFACIDPGTDWRIVSAECPEEEDIPTPTINTWKAQPTNPYIAELQTIINAIEGDRGSDQARLAKTGISLIDLLLRKNTDYGASAWSNPELANDMPAHKALLVRMSDKVNRIKALAKKPAPEVAESLADTFKDLAGYCLLWLACPDQVDHPEPANTSDDTPDWVYNRKV